MTSIARGSWFCGCLALAGVGLVSTPGCEVVPAPARVAVPTSSNREGVRERDAEKPLPPRDERIDLRGDQRPPPPPDAPTPPSGETAPPPPPDARGESTPDPVKVRKDFVDAYRKVGQPRFVVLVNRTLDGKLVAGDAENETYLKPDQYDAAAAKAVDLSGLEGRLVTEFGSDNAVNVIAPATAREKLTDAQVKDLEAGRAQALPLIDTSLNGDVLIQAQVLPTKQAGKGLELRIVAEVVNVRGGQVIGRAMADLDRPGDKGQMDAASQYVAQKLKIDMLRAWTAPQPDAKP